jgi:hypothetical protein
VSALTSFAVTKIQPPRACAGFIVAKLALQSRGQAAAWYRDRGTA